MEINENILKIQDKLYDFVKNNWRASLREPDGILKHKFMDPAAAYRGQMWDWDSYFCALGLIDIYDDTADYIKGCVLNFTEYSAIDGSIPYVIEAYPHDPKSSSLPPADKSPRTSEKDYNCIKPLLAQMALLASEKLRDFSWVEEIYDTFKKYIAHWEETQTASNGLFVWRSHRGSGTDNHPAVYGRPLNSSAGVDLNCLMYKEYLAMSRLAEVLGDIDNSVIYKEKADSLSGLINDLMWDEYDGLYYHLDCLSVKPTVARQEVTWAVPLKFKCWTCFMPMWAGIVPQERAERMIKQHLLNENEFFSSHGLRTVAKCEPIYNTVEMSNPSNWQGPIWIVSEYVMFEGLVKYGFYEDALRVAECILKTLTDDINENGLLHEFYNPETGKSTILPGFKNWNALAALMIPKLKDSII